MKRALSIVLLFLAITVAADEKGTARHFRAIRNNPVELTAFLREMPKGADLHNHLSGAIYGEEWLDEAEKVGAVYDTQANILTMTKSATTIPISQMKQQREYYEAWLDRVSMRSWTPNGHDHFFKTFGYMAPEGADIPDAAELAYAVKRAELQHERLLELMDLPIGGAFGVLTSGLPNTSDFDTLLKYVRSKAPAFTKRAIAALDQTSADAAKRLGYKYPLGDRRNPVYVRYIGAVNRNGSLRGMIVTLAATCELMKADKRFVGLQILAPEDEPVARRDFGKHMEIFDKVYKAYNHPNIALHCGEMTPNISPLVDMVDHIQRSIVTGHAKRVGHAIALAWETDMTGLLKRMRRDHICVEVCPTSNWAICGLKADHPIKTYVKYDVPVTLNTDDEGVLRSNRTMEFVHATEWWGFDYRTLKQFVRNSIIYSFTDGKAEELKRLDTEFRAFEKRWR